MNAGQRSSLAPLYRPREVVGTMSTRTLAWDRTGAAWCGFLPAYQTLRTLGAGEAPGGRREAEFPPYTDLQPQDALSVDAGPESGTRWRVLAVDHADVRKVMTQLEPYPQPLP